MSSNGGRLAAALLVAAVGGGRAAAHDLPLEKVMNAFVKVAPSELELVVRVPLDLLHAVPFPVDGPRYDLAAAGPATHQALGAIAESIGLWEGSARLVPSSAAGRFSLPSDRSFSDDARAAAHVAEPLEPDSRVYFDQGFFDARFTYPIASPASIFSVRTTVAPDLKDFARLSVRFLPLGQPGRAFLLTTSSGRVSLNPGWLQAARGFVVLGVEHILTGLDHLLFLLCLVLPLRRWRAILSVVTAFTLAHSVTLLGAAWRLAPDGAWFPPFVETAIAASIVFTALENVVGTSLRRRWLITAAFGLVHGFGFSYGLQERMQLAGDHLVVSLFAFNAGIELGQLAVLAPLLLALAALRRAVPERAAVIVVSALVAHTGWHWMLDRWQALAGAEWPRPDAASLTSAARWGAGMGAIGLAAWLAWQWAERRWPARAAQPEQRR